MHHTVQIVCPPEATDEVVTSLEKVDGVLTLLVHRGDSVRPPGDVVVVHALNRAVDDVLVVAAAAEHHGPAAVITSGVESIVATGAQQAIDDDADESPWEEFERTLRHHGRLSVNYLALMLVGGAIARRGPAVAAVPQALALAASAILAPAFEPVAGLALALVRRSGHAVGRTLVSIGVGYLLLAVGGGVAFVVLQALGLASPSTLSSSEGLHLIIDPTASDWLVAAGGAVAGLVIVTSFRQAVLAGALIALALVPAAATVGMGLASGDLLLAVQGLRRALLDMALVVVLGGLVVLAKDRFLHRGRRPLA